jgi:hypothetical protein
LDLDFAKPTVYSSEGTIISDSRANVTGLLINGPTFINSRTQRSAIQLSSAGNQYITLPASTLNGLSSWTIEFWLERNITNSIDSFLTCGAGNEFLWFFGNSDGRLEYQNTGSSTLPYTVTNDVPFHFVATGSGGSSGTITVYRNGTSVGTISNNTTITVNSSLGVVLGQELDSNTGTGSIDTNQSWKGKYYVVRFYNRVLSTNEVTQQYNATRWRFGV